MTCGHPVIYTKHSTNIALTLDGHLKFRKVNPQA
jgi:hypothetical protein